MKLSPLASYEGQIKTFLSLLVLFLAAAILLDVQLLVVARDAVQEETGRRLALEADLVRAELERDQMLRGLRGEPGTAAPYIPPTLLERQARLRGLATVDILGLDGRVISSSDASRVGRADPYLTGDPAAARRVAAGLSVVGRLDRVPRTRYARLAAYAPIRDRSRTPLATVRVLSDVPVLATVHFNLTLIAAVQAAALVCLVGLLVFFVRWLLQPYRRLMNAAGQAPGAVPGIGAPAGGEPDYLAGAFQSVLDKLRAQEGELQRLRQDRGAAGAMLPGDRIIGGMTSAVLVFDREGRLTVLNGPAEKMLGLDRGAAIGRKYGDLLGHAERLVDLVGRCLKHGEHFSREVVPVAGRGRGAAHLGAMVAPIRPGDPNAPGAADGVLCLLADLTEIKTLRERVGLKENLAALGEMSAGIAHEFRNSLAAIHGLARLIVKGSGDGAVAATARENAETILREVGAVEKVVTDFLRYARPAPLDLAEVDLADLAAEVIRECRGDLLFTGVTVAAEGAFATVTGDAALLRQALQNLLRNAAESFGPPEDRATRPAPRIVVRGDPEPGAGVRLVIEDNGGGIPAGDLPHLFTPFFTTKDRGTGLGLALVQKAIVEHDGRVEVSSRPGEGTRFVILLPERPGGSSPGAPL